MDDSRAPQPGSAAWQGTTRELPSALKDLVEQRRADQHQDVPRDEDVAIWAVKRAAP